MTLTDYAAAAAEVAFYPGAGAPEGLAYSALGLNGESGEVAELVKKMLRDDGGLLTDERRGRLRKELGDVLWYVAAAARDAGLSLEDVAAGNIAKLRSRQRRGVLGGDGDDR